MHIESIIFDAMGVLFPIGDDTNDLLVPFVRERNPAISSDEINALYWEASLGRISSEMFWQGCRIPGSALKDLEYSYLNSNLKLDAAFLPVAKALRSRGFRLGMLSNDIGEWSAFLRSKFGLNPIFEACVISGDAGIRKPDRRIYELICDKLKSKPENCLYIDDRVKNLLPAKELGMRVIRFAREKTGAMNTEGIREITSFGDLPGLL